MLSAVVLRGCRRLTMPVARSPHLRSVYPRSTCPNPRGSLNFLNPRLLPMKTGGGAGVYVPPIPRLRSMIASANGTLTTARSVDYDWRDGGGQGIAVSPPPPATTSSGGDGYPSYFHQQSSHYARYAYDDYSDDESDRDVEALPGSNKVCGISCWSCFLMRFICRYFYSIQCSTFI